MDSKKGFPGGSVVKNLPANAGYASSIPGSGRSCGEGNATHSSILVWEIPWTEEPNRATVHGVAESDTTEQLTQMTLVKVVIIHSTNMY